MGEESDPFAGTGGSRLPALGWEPLWGRSLLAMGIPVDRPMIGGGSLLAMGILVGRDRDGVLGLD